MRSEKREARKKIQPKSSIQRREKKSIQGLDFFLWINSSDAVDDDDDDPVI